MLAGPNETIDTMQKAVAYSIAALQAGSEIDIDRSEADRAFFAEEKQKLDLIFDGLTNCKSQLERFDLTLGIQNQVNVILGDTVLDNGLRVANGQTKLSLRNASGLGAEHVFGARIDDLTSEKLQLEPSLVIEASSRFDDIADFPTKAQLKADLIARARKQEELLITRDAGYAERSRLQGNAVRVVTEAADALLRTKAALDGRFPRQRTYIAQFFFDVGRSRQRKADPPTTPTE